MAVRIMTRNWPVEMISSRNLIIEVPCFIDKRPQILELLIGLVVERLDMGLKTIILDAEDFGSVHDILVSIPAEKRATIVLRLPEGRGRYRYAAHHCRNRGIPLKYARELATMEPWDYDLFFEALDGYAKALQFDSQ